MLPSTSSSWMLLLAHVFVPSDFRKEWNRLFCLSCLPASFLHGCLPHFSLFLLLFQIETLHPSSEALHLLSEWYLKEGHRGRANTRKMSHTKSLKTWDYFISEMTNRGRHGKRAENNGWDREGGLNSSVPLPLTARKRVLCFTVMRLV